MELDRAAGALVGLAAGDALGAGYEFGPALSQRPEMVGGGLGGWAPGEWTDDTQMAVCLAEAAATGTLVASDVGDRFLDWLASGPADVGVQTGAVLRAARSGSDLRAAAAAYHSRSPDNSAGNGSLMRTAPVALAHLGDDDAIASAAMEVSLLTHGDPLAGEACVLWCVAIDRAVREGRLDGLGEGLDRLPAQSRDRWAAWIDDAEASPPGTFNPNGLVVSALQAAWAAITQTSVPDDTPCLHLQHALERAVQVGHDTDTVAAIAGQLLGARWGASAVPLRWRAMVHGWPGYRVRDLVRLAVPSARGGESDAAGWPVAARLVPHYREAVRARGFRTPLAEDDGVLLGDAAAVEGAGTDVVVSLCRMGPDDVDPGVEHHELWLIDTAPPEHNPNLAFLLRDVAGAVAGWRDDGRTVLVHCARAESRTPTVAAANACLVRKHHELSARSRALSLTRRRLIPLKPELADADDWSMAVRRAPRRNPSLRAEAKERYHRQFVLLWRRILVILVVGIAALVPLVAIQRPNFRGFTAGVFLTSLVWAIVVAVRDTGGLGSLSMGIEAELWTSDELRKVRGGSVIDAIDLGGRDVDHVLMADSGVFAVETKWCSSGWSLKGRKRTFVEQAAAQATRSARDIRLRLFSEGVAIEVTPVVFLWGRQLEPAQADISEVAGVTVVPGKRAGAWRESLPTQGVASGELAAARHALSAFMTRRTEVIAKAAAHAVRRGRKDRKRTAPSRA